MVAASILIFPAAARGQNNYPDGGAVDSLAGTIRQRLATVDKGGANSAATGLRSKTHSVPALDGDLFLR
jgi:hypothetical protein